MRAFFLVKTLFFICLVCLMGCSNSLNAPIKYYQFEQTVKPMDRKSSETDTQLRINTVTLRGALNNRGIAMKTDNNQLSGANYHLWAEAPDIMLTASAHQTLFSQMTNWMVVKGLPVITDKDQQRFYELEYEIQHFNGDNQGNADIAGLWRLYITTFEGGRSLLEIHYFNEVTPLIDDDYDGLVKTLERTWQSINIDVANQLTTLQTVTD